MTTSPFTESMPSQTRTSENSDSASRQGDVVISVKNVSKKFCRNLRRSMVYGIKDLSQNLLGMKPDTSQLRKDEFWALNNVNFELRRGETLGIIGVNGSGKSTLLRVLTGIFPPDKGEIMVKGRIGALVAIGAGFHPHMTGRENLYLNGTILGMTRKQIEERFNDIVDFAEIEEFLDAPVSTYSSGMRVRLGFAIAVHVDPDILLIDEVLSVGDLSFRNKSVRKIHELRQKAKGIIFVSHNLEQVLNISDRILIFDKGKTVFNGLPEEGIKQYHQINNERQHIYLKKGISKQNQTIGHVSSGDISIESIGLQDEQGKRVETIHLDEDIRVFCNLNIKKTILKPRISVGIRDTKDDNIIWHINREQKALFNNLQPGRYRLEVTFSNPSLEANTYKIFLGIQDIETLEYYEKFTSMGQNVFTVKTNKISRGVIACESKWSLYEIV